jgi:hypothetical protein
MVDSLAPICREKLRIRSFHPASSSRTCTSCAGALVPQTIDRPLARSVSNPINETETGCLPHQFRPRNNRHEHLRLCMKIIENTLFLPRQHPNPCSPLRVQSKIPCSFAKILCSIEWKISLQASEFARVSAFEIALSRRIRRNSRLISLLAGNSRVETGSTCMRAPPSISSYARVMFTLPRKRLSAVKNVR